MRLAVIGTGYVGLVAGAGFADFGIDVTCVDSDDLKIARLLRGQLPIDEPGLDLLVERSAKRGNLRFSSNVAAAVRRAEVVFVAPNRVIVGCEDGRARAILRQLYAPFLRTNDRLQLMDPASAELAKYASNAMRAVRISFMNELALLAERLGADVEQARRAVGADPRIGPKFLYAGAGYGGSCFPKDLKALAVVAAADAANERRKHVLPDKIERWFAARGGLAGKTLCVWGVAIKPGSDANRDAPAVVLIDRLLAAGARVVAYDPVAADNARARYGGRIMVAPGMYQAAEGADALVLVTEWHELRGPDFARLLGTLREPVLFDGRNVWDPAETRGLGFVYHGIGRR